MPSALSVARPAAAAVALFAAVAVTGFVLYLSWPVGIAVGVALGAGAVLAIGARMQVSDRLQPVDAELAERLGIASAVAPERTVPELVAAVPAADPVASPPVVTAPARSAPVAPAIVAPTLHVQPDVLYFTSDDDPDAVEVREVVTAANDIITVPEQQPAPVEAAAPAALPDPVRADLEQLKVDLGEDYRDFARAARLVVSTQYASAARLQRDLDLPYSRARRLLSDLEERHFVGPATGSLPRQVLLPKERLPELEELLADA